MYLPADCDPLKAKRDFAEALLRTPADPYRAARVVFPRHMQAVMFIVQEWVHDPYIKELQDQFIELNGAEYYLPSMVELAHEVYTTAIHANMTADKVKSFELYAKLRGFIDKPSNSNTNVNLNVDNRVLVIEKYSEAEVEASQARLLREAAEDVA